MQKRVDAFWNLRSATCRISKVQSADKCYRNFPPWFGLTILVMVDSVQCPLQGTLTKTRRQRSQARVRHGRSRLTDLLCMYPGYHSALFVHPRLFILTLLSNYLMSQSSGTDGAEHQHPHDDLAERLSPENDNIGPTEE
ncbi:hypothetical protein CY34DRAFT_647776 [Suillus luteus UH-Slu-Lm8-n1]|uniref:Unplaced genomic scaffold CY34scaffold_64, whole genome shotgun sequence n=1 Tax=Suillus luteus UH-Slu-Lm8-n1 TaxID=930992 RepID=A0A0D0AR38_9AGAM|nr:hypothetical protein CY34DRAFT_647776 [Suillus luteus UH-Slu-Lm8-n1]